MERREYNRRWDSAHPELAREYDQRQKDPTHSYYWTARESKWRSAGIQRLDGASFTRADFWNFWFEQKGACAMCGRLFGAEFETAVRKANVDHWHKRGKYGPARALLCWLCNKRVGDLAYETALPLWKYLSRFAPSLSEADSASTFAKQNASPRLP